MYKIHVCKIYIHFLRRILTTQNFSHKKESSPKYASWVGLSFPISSPLSFCAAGNLPHFLHDFLIFHAFQGQNKSPKKDFIMSLTQRKDHSAHQISVSGFRPSFCVYNERCANTVSIQVCVQ